MITEKMLEALAADDQKLQEASRKSFDNEALTDGGIASDLKAALWNIAFKAGASHGSLKTAKMVHAGWKDAAERAAISNQLLLRKK